MLEHRVVLQEQRLLVLRRQLLTGEHHVRSRLARLERGYLIFKRRLKPRWRQIFLDP
jgi:hypothetical protein